MTSQLVPVGVFVPDDNQQLIERMIPPSYISKVHVNDHTRHFPIDIFIGQSESFAKRLNKNKSCFVLTEPPEIFTYSSSFLDHFDFVAGPNFQYLNNRKNFLTCNPIIPYFVGVDFPRRSNIKSRNYLKPLRRSKPLLPRVKFSIDDLIRLQMEKTKSLSAIVSSKQMTPHQVDRVNFIKYLENNSRIPLTISGDLKAPVQDKFSILRHSTHHIAIENSIHNDYWTEKLADSILALNFTFYAGAPNLEEYFDKATFQPISLRNFKQATQLIEHTFFSSPVDVDILRQERLKLINENSLMGLVKKLRLLI